MYKELPGTDLCYPHLMSTAQNICKTTPLMVTYILWQFESKWVGAVEDLSPANQFVDLRVKPMANILSLTADTGRVGLSEFKTHLAYNITVYRMKKERQNRFNKDDVVEVYRNTTANKSLSCLGSDCRELVALRLGIDHVGSYFMVLQFNVTQDIHDNIQTFVFSAQTLNPDYAYLAVAVKVVLFIASVINALLFFLDLYRAKRLHVTPVFEQTFLKYLNIALVMFFDPVNIFHSVRSSTFT